MATYIALLRKDASSDYGVDFPDLPGCVTAGRTLEEARIAAAEALSLHLEGLAEDGEAAPEPSSTDQVMADPHNRDAVAFLVDAAPSTKPVRVNVMLPSNLLRRIDQTTRNRSRFLAEAAREKLEHI